MTNLIIEICPREPRSEVILINGESVAGSDFEQDLIDCTGPGDAQNACEYILDQIGVEFRIVAQNSAGKYENRLATAAEKRETCEKIYFESNSDFSDERLVEIYLVWEAAHNAFV